MELGLLPTNQMNSYHSALPHFYDQSSLETFVNEFYASTNVPQNCNNTWTSDEQVFYKLSSYPVSSSSPLTSPVYCDSITTIHHAVAKEHYSSNSVVKVSNETVSFYNDTSGGHSCEIKLPRKRNTANKKERRRTHSINSAFSKLRERIPNVPKDTKLSKIKTLKLAALYIKFLNELLNQSSDQSDERKPLVMSCEDFKVDLQRFKGSNKSENKLVS